MSVSVEKRYQKVRNRQICYAYDRRITNFLNSYVKGNPTVLFLPGGMGSQLCISEKKFKKSKSFKNSKYPVIWYDTGLVFSKDFKQMTLNMTENGYVDYKNHIVIPDGEVRFLYKPYDVTEKYFKKKGYNYLVFGFDWRRQLNEGVGYFIRFLKQLKERTILSKNENPLPQLNIIGHSQGGLILHLWLLRQFKDTSKEKEVKNWFNKLITVGTPFYGTANHIQRYFEGEGAFNLLYGQNTVRKVLGSLPGPYYLMPLDYKSYLEKKDQLGLSEYPLLDKNNNVVDPYDPKNFDFFPGWVSKKAIEEAAQLKTSTRRSVCEAACQYVYNIYASGNKKTKRKLVWDIDHSPGNESISGKNGAGDGTVPTWSGSLVEVPATNKAVLKKLDNHVALMEHPDTLQSILHILNNEKLPQEIQHKKYKSQIKSLPEPLEEYLGKVKDKTIKQNSEQAINPGAWKKFMEETWI